MDWWQWLDHGASRPTSYDIKVVVFRGISLNEIKNKYPINPNKEIDFRFLTHQRALTYLNEKIEDNVVERLTATLEDTRDKIVNELGE
jgi:hypothetical protein